MFSVHSVLTPSLGTARCRGKGLGKRCMCAFSLLTIISPFLRVLGIFNADERAKTQVNSIVFVRIDAALSK